MQQQSNMNTQNQGVLYQEPPAVISTKDTMYLTDMLSWNLLAMKKAHFFAQQCHDPEIVSALESCGQMHQRHYERILSHLNVQNQTQQQSNNGMM
ncbi:hypothetical protein [Niallia endozanthoxylica]|uniref:Uncharacterized protein n=1 Tax=Niallia endozanthoxylica TaxID=2036016 RepID=A0A5J5HGW4_9BACI|nr:hypothetical protein [Niallia endozanthoxylica]KAA9019999.1 hypothetical protein F4V44_19050 [Niallia endozanthoxylica]